MERKIITLLLILMVGVTIFSARPVYAAGDPPIDLSLDRSGNQISDAVEIEVATLQVLPADQRTAEIEHFVSKLPIAADTLALQERAQQLSMSLSAAKPEETQAILEELAKVSSELQEDPVIHKVESDLLTLTGIGITDRTTPSLSVAWSSLQKGDILARRSGAFVVWPWAMWYEHTGNFWGNSAVLEPYPKIITPSDGVRLHPLSEWKVVGNYVGLARNKFASSTAVSQAVDWAATTYGLDGRTPYNFAFWNKYRDSALYCSQLTWKIHKHAGYDLDSNDWLYLLAMAVRYGPNVIPTLISAVAPDEVMLSPYVDVYSEGWY